MPKKLVMFLLLVSVFLASSWVLIFKPLFPIHDYVHGARIAEMGRALADGQIPPRWSSNFGYGYGMPLFNFYAPLPYFVGGIFFNFGMSLESAVKLVFLVGNLIALIGAYALGKEKFGRAAGLLLASLYVLAPYRAVNLYVRGALSESWGMALLPLVLLGGGQVLARRPLGFFTLSVSIAALVLSHNLTAMIALPALLILAVIWHFQSQGSKFTLSFIKEVVLRLLPPTLVGFGLSAFYLLPSVLEKNLTQLDNLIQTGYFDFHHHFLYLRQFVQENWGYGGSGWGPDDGISFFLGYPQLLGLMLIILLIISKLNNTGRLHWRKFITQHLLLWTTMLFFGLSVLLTTPKTVWLWENLPLLSFLQFPWRFLALISFLLSLMVSYVVSRLVKNNPTRLVIIGILFLSTLILSSRYFKPKEYLQDSTALYYAEPERIQAEMSSVLPDYLPTDLDPKLLPAPHPEFIGLTATEMTRSEVLVSRSHAKLYQFNLENTREIELPIAYFPGWQVEIDGEPAPAQISDRGLIQVSVPAGEARVGAVFGETPIRMLSNIITLMSAVCLMIVYRSKILCQKIK